MENIITIGITGGIGSGKSFVCRIIAAMGYPVFYSDQAAKDIMVNSTEAIKEIKAVFGNEAYTSSGELNKKYLSTKIFSDASLRDEINKIVHPKVRAAFLQMAQDSDSKIIFNEAAIFFETGAHVNFDRMILVAAPKEVRTKRVMMRDGISKEAVESRMKAQWPDEKKAELADFIINNDELQLLLPQIENVIFKILE
jgi:dephospho-CoA kinase